MTSSDTSIPRKKSWGRRILIALVVLLALYSVGWYFAATRVQSEVDTALQRLNDRGVIAQCSNRSVGGFPLGMSLNCDALNYEDAAHNIFITSGALRSRASLFNPRLVGSDLTSPLRLTAPQVPPIVFDWKELRSTVTLARPNPSEIAFAGADFKAETDPDDETDPVPLFQAASFQTVVRPTGDDLDYQGAFANLRIDPAAIGGRQIPLLNGSGDLRVLRGVSLLRTQPDTFRNQAIEVRSLTLTSGTSSVALSGPIAIGADGLINADVNVKVTDAAALTQTLQQAFPEHAKDIGRGMMGVAFFGKNISLPLKITNGQAALGPIPLGFIPPLD